MPANESELYRCSTRRKSPFMKPSHPANQLKSDESQARNDNARCSLDMNREGRPDLVRSRSQSAQSPILPRVLHANLWLLPILGLLWFLIPNLTAKPDCSPSFIRTASHLGIDDICPGYNSTQIYDTFANNETVLSNWKNISTPGERHITIDIDILLKSQHFFENFMLPNVRVHHREDMLKWARIYKSHVSSIWIQCFSFHWYHVGYLHLDPDTYTIFNDIELQKHLLQWKIDLYKRETNVNKADYIGHGASRRLGNDLMKRMFKEGSEWAKAQQTASQVRLDKILPLEAKVHAAIEAKTNWHEAFQKAWKIWLVRCTRAISHESDYFQTPTIPMKNRIYREDYCVAFQPEVLREDLTKNVDHETYLEDMKRYLRQARLSSEELLGYARDLGQRVEAAKKEKHSFSKTEVEMLSERIMEKILEKEAWLRGVLWG